MTDQKLQEQYFESPDAYTGKSYDLNPPAKLNLRLVVEGRNKEGYHLLSLLNVLVDLRDSIKLTFDKGDSISLTVDGASTPSDPDANLATRAVTLFKERFDLHFTLNVTLKKNIPVGGGFGGGSSDAGSMLAFLGRCFNAHLKSTKEISPEMLSKELLSLGLKIGADVPFFIRSGLARVSGIGEKVDRFDGKFLSGVPCLLVSPPVHNSTSDVYAAYRVKFPSIPYKRDMAGETFGETLRLNSPGTEYDPQPSKTIRASLWRKLVVQVKNDFEDLMSSFAPDVATLLGELRALDVGVAGMTGSGSGLFIIPRTLDGFTQDAIEKVRAVAEGRGARLIQTTLIDK